MYRQLIFTILFFSVITTVFSQGNVGSPYYKNGIGKQTHSSGVRNLGMGGLGYTLPYNGNVSFLNPANTRDIDSLTFILDVGLNGGIRKYTITDPFPGTSHKTDFQLSHIVFGFPMTKWWKSSLGYTPYSNYSYSISSKDDSFDVSKKYLYSGHGGINRLIYNNSFILYKGLSVGINTSFLFGKIQDASALVFEKAPGFLNLYEKNTLKISDIHIELGSQYSFEINEKNTLILGATFNLTKKLNVKKDVLIFNSLSNDNRTSDTITNILNEKGIIRLPQTIGFGLGYLYNNRFYLGIDYTNKNQKNAYFFNQQENLKNGHLIVIGCEYTPNGLNRISYKYSKAISYRLGAYVDNSYVKTTEGQAALLDYGISFGFGLPMKRSKSGINISAQLGQRGSNKNGLIKERYAIIGINFNLNDMWFIKSKID